MRRIYRIGMLMFGVLVSLTTAQAIVPTGLTRPLSKIGINWYKHINWNEIQEQYANNHETWDLVLDWIAHRDLYAMQPGTYYIGPDSIVAKVQDTQTRAESRIEAHVQYIDLQWTYSGTERYQVYDRADIEATDKYNPTKDVQHYAVKPGKKPRRVILSDRKSVCLFFPSEPHQALLEADTTAGPAPVRKLVIKIPYLHGDLQQHEREQELQQEYGDVLMK